MSVTVAQATSLLENILFEPPALAAANAPAEVALSANNFTDSSLGGLAQSIAAMPEATITETVVRYYETLLGRAPAGAEIQSFVSLAETGLSAAQIAQGISAVPASTLACPR